MRVEGSTGSPSFALGVQGYQFSDATSVADQYDANWLMVKLHARTDSARWTTIEPCILPWELRTLADWFARVALREPKTVTEVNYDTRGPDAVTFVEPNVAFSVADYPSGGSTIIRVHLSFVALGEGSDADEIYGEHIDVELERDAVLEAAASLNADCLTYPVR